jgi:hypothetical protein
VVKGGAAQLLESAASWVNVRPRKEFLTIHEVCVTVNDFT